MPDLGHGLPGSEVDRDTGRIDLIPSNTAKIYNYQNRNFDWEIWMHRARGANQLLKIAELQDLLVVIVLGYDSEGEDRLDSFEYGRIEVRTSC